VKTLYLDMDGVVADFDEYAKRTLGIPPSGGIYPDYIWKQLATNPRIYRDLIPTPYAQKLYKECVNFCLKHNYEWAFLTAVPKGNDVKFAFYDKVEWAQKHFPSTPVFFGPYSKDKHQHCQVGDILIDDRTSNIEEWIAAGGIAILHKDLQNTVAQLHDLTPQFSLQA
jgi:5'(3')-deoxyribonucleotidase